MRMDDKWLAQVVVVNDNTDISVGGDVSIFRNGMEACTHLEPWWVEAGEGLALTGTGERVVFGIDGPRVVIVRCEPYGEGMALLNNWLRHAAIGVLATRMKRARTNRAALTADEARGEVPRSIEGLIAYVGFQR